MKLAPGVEHFFQFVHFLFLMIISETVAQNFFFAFPKFKLKAASSVESLVLNKRELNISLLQNGLGYPLSASRLRPFARSNRCKKSWFNENLNDHNRGISLNTTLLIFGVVKIYTATFKIEDVGSNPTTSDFLREPAVLICLSWHNWIEGRIATFL